MAADQPEALGPVPWYHTLLSHTMTSLSSRRPKAGAWTAGFCWELHLTPLWILFYQEGHKGSGCFPEMFHPPAWHPRVSFCSQLLCVMSVSLFVLRPGKYISNQYSLKMYLRVLLLWYICGFKDVTDMWFSLQFYLCIIFLKMKYYDWDIGYLIQSNFFNYFTKI